MLDETDGCFNSLKIVDHKEDTFFNFVSGWNK